MSRVLLVSWICEVYFIFGFFMVLLKNREEEEGEMVIMLF